jgi:hypothetical protein
MKNKPPVRNENLLMNAFHQLQEINLKLMPTGLEIDYLDDQYWANQGIKRCIVAVQRQKLPQNVRGMRVTSHDADHDIFRLHIIINDHQNRKSNQKNCMSQEIVAANELAHSMAILSSMERHWESSKSIIKIFKEKFSKRLYENSLVNFGKSGIYLSTANESMVVPISDKTFIGIGKMIFELKTEQNSLGLRFTVDKTVSGNYEATLIEFGLVSWSETEEEAIISLVKQTRFHIQSIMENTGFDGLIREIDDNQMVMGDYWKHYGRLKRFVDYHLKDSDKEKENRLTQKIETMGQEENVEKATFPIPPPAITYTEVGLLYEQRFAGC